MENMRRGEGHPHNNTRNGKNKDQPPMGFEGMNYEQKRKPYSESSNDKIRNSNSINGSDLGKMRDDL